MVISSIKITKSIEIIQTFLVHKSSIPLIFASFSAQFSTSHLPHQSSQIQPNHAPFTADTAFCSPTSFSLLTNFEICSGTYRTPISTFTFLPTSSAPEEYKTYLLDPILRTFNRRPIRSPGRHNTNPSLRSKFLILHIGSIVRRTSISDLC